MSEFSENFENRLDLSEIESSISAIRNEIGKIIYGQELLTDLILNSILSSGHVLIEGVPGVAKTLTAKLLAATIDAPYKRIQFTPDLMPSDVIGTSIFNPKSLDFELKKGPAFTNILLIDEINRAPAKTQSSLFELMQERQITIDGISYKLEEPFIVLATQNPVEHEGTYKLPEAQLDRFLVKIDVDYPDYDSELSILNKHHNSTASTLSNDVNIAISADKIKDIKSIAQKVLVDEKIVKYTADFLKETRSSHALYLGASPRAGIDLIKASKSNAVMNGRDFVTPDDVKFMAPHVISHRLILTPEKELEGIQSKDIVKEIIETVEVPR